MRGPSSGFSSGLLAVLLCTAVPATLRAQEEPPPAVPGQSVDEQAQRLADEAVEAYRTGTYDKAVKLFKQAYALRADPAILYNLAKCFDKMGRPEGALEYYRRYLVAENTDPKLRQKAEEKVATLSAAASRAAAPAALQPQAPQPPPERPGRLFFYSGVGLAAAGVVGLVIGVSLYGAAAKDFGTFTGSTDEIDKRAARDRVQSLGKGSIAGYVVGTALLGGGAALVGLAVRKGFFRKEGSPGDRRGASRSVRKEGRVAFDLAPAPGGAAVLLSGSF
jgi:Flp pilus assembly protein TadD